MSETRGIININGRKERKLRKRNSTKSLSLSLISVKVPTVICYAVLNVNLIIWYTNITQIKKYPPEALVMKNENEKAQQQISCSEK
jgi:hypothetical protein